MLVQDLRYALRQLRHAPGFAVTVALTLALSVGVATAVFCVIDTVILRPLPYAHPERIVVAETLVFERMESWLFGIFACLALSLALGVAGSARAGCPRRSIEPMQALRTE